MSSRNHQNVGDGGNQCAGHGETLPARCSKPRPARSTATRRSIRSRNRIAGRQPDRPPGCYDEGKRAAETLFMDYHRMNGVNIRIVRIFNTYGPRMHPFDGRVVSNFIRQALAGEDITIFGDGRQTRSFCYRDDLVEGIIRMMERHRTTSSARSISAIPDDSHPGVGRTGAGVDRLAVEAGPPAAAGRRSRRAAGPTSRWPQRSGWEPTSRSARAWRRPSTGSARSTSATTARPRRTTERRGRVSAAAMRAEIFAAVAAVRESPMS